MLNKYLIQNSANFSLSDVKFNKDGLIPVISQCANTGKVLMMAWMNEDALEKTLGKKAKINFLPLQPGDVPDTYANVDNLKKQFNYKPEISVFEGVSNFVKWYKDYYKI